jgi:hypothetical protein
MRDSLLDSMHVGNDGPRFFTCGRDVIWKDVKSFAHMMCLPERQVGSLSCLPRYVGKSDLWIRIPAKASMLLSAPTTPTFYADQRSSTALRESCKVPLSTVSVEMTPISRGNR